MTEFKGITENVSNLRGGVALLRFLILLSPLTTDQNGWGRSIS
jgi:hypothetical protein